MFNLPACSGSGGRKANSQPALSRTRCVQNQMPMHFIFRKCILPISAFFLFILWIPANAQEIKPSERYKDAYKKYLDATCPIKKDSIQHFVYFARDRELIKDHPFLSHSMFKGAQIMYSWRQLEPEKGKYNFSVLQLDYKYLKKFKKKLFFTLQDVTFNASRKAVPDYILTSGYDGGATEQYNDDGRPGGWVSKRWNKKVRERFSQLLQALGRAFDGKIEGINLQETAIEVKDSGFSELDYVTGIKENMLALKQAFPKSITMIYANFMPGEWLPGNDKGYLRSIYQYGEQIGVGLGGPDLMVKRKGQLNHTLAMMHESHYTVPLGIAIEDGNYIGETGDATEDKNKIHESIVPLLYAFAKDFLKVTYMFWANQEPYFKEDVLSCFYNDN